LKLADELKIFCYSEEEKNKILINKLKDIEEYYLNQPNIQLEIKIIYEDNLCMQFSEETILRNPKNFFDYIKESDLDETNISDHILRVETNTNSECFKSPSIINNSYYYFHTKSYITMKVYVSKDAFVYFDLLELINGNEWNIEIEERS